MILIKEILRKKVEILDYTPIQNTAIFITSILLIYSIFFELVFLMFSWLFVDLNYLSFRIISAMFFKLIVSYILQYSFLKETERIEIKIWLGSIRKLKQDKQRTKKILLPFSKN